MTDGLRAFTLLEGQANVLGLEATTGTPLSSAGSINSLPDEVLIRIFQWVMYGYSSSFEQLVDEDSLPKNSLAISQACTRWRRVALGTRNLWSHVELCFSTEVIELGRAFASRVGGLPLSVRIVEPSRGWQLWGANRYREVYIALLDFASAFGPHTCSFELALQPPLTHYPKLWFYSLEYGLMCASDKLTRLCLLGRNHYAGEILADEYYDTHGHWFFFSREMDKFTTIVSRYGGWEYLDIAWEKLENILHNIKVLELELIYPFWTSKAYHGLTELRLIGPRKLTAIITVQDLASILAASPALRIFQFGLEISRSEVSPPPTHLECLEVLILQSLGFDSQQAVLRLLLPSARLLRVAMAYNEIANQFLPALNGDETDNFFSRSNVLELHVHSRVIVDLPRLFQLLPDLRTLVLHEARISGHSTSRPVTATCTRSFLLQLHSCMIDWDALLWAISAQNIQKVMLFRTKVEKGTEVFDGENLRSALLAICPSVQISDSSSSEDAIKIEGWSEDMYGRIGYARRDNFHVL